ncbi:MAG: class I SAM-dependent methyltransferase [Alphaproteobacteria bacterium]
MWITSVLIALVFAAGGLYVLHKVRAIHRQIYALEDRLETLVTRDMPKAWRQIEAVLHLQRELGLVPGLSPTREWIASPDLLIELARHVRRAKPKRVVECGSGASTVVIARALQQNGAGHIYSLDHDPTFAEITRQRLIEAGLSDYATVITAPLREQNFGAHRSAWYNIPILPDGPYDLVVIDGPPEIGGTQARYPAGPTLVSRLAPGGVVFVDDTVRTDEQEIAARWIQENAGLTLEDRPWFDKGLMIIRKAA